MVRWVHDILLTESAKKDTPLLEDRLEDIKVKELKVEARVMKVRKCHGTLAVDSTVIQRGLPRCANQTPSPDLLGAAR